MANTPAKKTTQATATEEKEIDAAKMQKENDELRKTLEEMKAQIALLTQAQAAQTNVVSQAPKRPERNISIINLTPGTLVLRGNQIYKIEGQFNSMPFSEREARIIINNMRKTFIEGYCYVADAEFVEENDLDAVYKTILDDAQLKNLFNTNFDKVVEMYKSTSDVQKKIIVDMIKQKKAKGDYIDANILVEIGKLCGEELINIEVADE